MWNFLGRSGLQTFIDLFPLKLAASFYLICGGFGARRPCGPHKNGRSGPGTNHELIRFPARLRVSRRIWDLRPWERSIPYMYISVTLTVFRFLAILGASLGGTGHTVSHLPIHYF